jgi:hypothetical protein
VSSGKWYDYMPLWYTEVGAKITKTMMINSITPYIGLASSIMVPKIKICLDKRKAGKLGKADGKSYRTA